MPGVNVNWDETKRPPGWKPRLGPKNGNWGGGVRCRNGYRWIRPPEGWPDDGRKYPYVPEHVAVVWLARGRKPLPKGAVVHHVDGNGLNNSPSNLVVCQDDNYHFLLHIRQRAMAACGKPTHMRCRYCGQYDDPANMWVNQKTRTARHRKCHAEYEARRQNARG